MQKTVTINNNKYTLIKRVSAEVISDICRWKDLLHSDMVCIENGIVYFYKILGYDEEIKNENTPAISSRKRY